MKNPHRRFTFKSVAAAIIAIALLAAIAANADLAVVANDGHATLVNGVTVIPAKPAGDNAAIIDLSASPARLIAEIPGVPSSVIGPPLSVAIAPDESFAVVTGCMKADPANPGKQTEDNSLTVIDLKASPACVIARLQAGRGPAGISINRQGTLALVANRGDGSVSLFTINGKKLAPAGTLQVGNAASALGHVVFTPDGKRALVTRDGDHMVTVLAIDGAKVTLAGRDIRTGLRPYGIDVTADGRYAVAANVGYANGDVDTISLIDLSARPERVVDIAPVGGMTPEGVKISPDGRLCAVVNQNGSNKPKESPFFADAGQLVLFRIENGKLIRLAEAPIGHWSQGVAFAADNRRILVTNMVEGDIQTFHWDGKALVDLGERLKMRGGPAAIRTAEQPAK